jgi:hypothetical protein
MKKLTVLPCILFMGTMAAAQTSAPVPAGTALMVKLETTLATFSNKPGDPFQGRLTQAVVLRRSHRGRARHQSGRTAPHRG